VWRLGALRDWIPGAITHSIQWPGRTGYSCEELPAPRPEFYSAPYVRCNRITFILQRVWNMLSVANLKLQMEISRRRNRRQRQEQRTAISLDSPSVGKETFSTWRKISRFPGCVFHSRGYHLSLISMIPRYAGGSLEFNKRLVVGNLWGRVMNINQLMKLELGWENYDS